MRREHSSIIVDVLDALARYGEENRGAFRVTVLAAKANLPHARLREYLAELAGMDLLSPGPVPMVTPKGRQFLECYYAWERIQELYGLHLRSALEAPMMAHAEGALKIPNESFAVALGTERLVRGP